MGIRAHDVNYGVIPLSHSYGLGNLVAPLLMQGTPIALRELFLPAQLAADARATGPVSATGCPIPVRANPLPASRGGEAYRRQCAFSSPPGRGSTWNLVTSFKKELGTKIHSFYGSSETGGITYDDEEDDNDDDDDKISDPLTVGKPMPETEVTLRRDERVHVHGTLSREAT